MSEFTWQDSYSVGVPELDDQHKVLIDLINQLETIEQDGGDMRDVMNKLDWYVKTHFALEEDMMETAGYADLADHAAEHWEFEAWLKAAQSHMATAGIGNDILVQTVRERLKHWLKNHILVSDMAYKGKLGT